MASKQNVFFILIVMFAVVNLPRFQLVSCEMTTESDATDTDSDTDNDIIITKKSTEEVEKKPVDEPKVDVVDSPATETTEQQQEDKDKQAEKDLMIFRKLFLEKRSQHFQAVSSLLETYDYEKTYQMIDLLLTRMRTVLGSAKLTLVDKGFEPGMPFPTDDETKDALAVIMENAGLFGDMALKLPDITHACLVKKKSEVSEMLKWSITYSQDLDFLDDLNSQIFNLAAQELDIIPKDPGFINPYRQEFQAPPPPPAEKKKKAKAEKKRGPRATKVEL